MWGILGRLKNIRTLAQLMLDSLPSMARMVAPVMVKQAEHLISELDKIINDLEAEIGNQK